MQLSNTAVQVNLWGSYEFATLLNQGVTDDVTISLFLNIISMLLGFPFCGHSHVTWPSYELQRSFNVNYYITKVRY